MEYCQCTKSITGGDLAMRKFDTCCQTFRDEYNNLESLSGKINVRGYWSLNDLQKDIARNDYKDNWMSIIDNIYSDSIALKEQIDAMPASTAHFLTDDSLKKIRGSLDNLFQSIAKTRDHIIRRRDGLCTAESDYIDKTKTKN